MTVEEIPFESADDLVVRALVEVHGYTVRPKLQLGMQQWECSVENGNLLSFKYIKDGTAIQFYLSMTTQGPNHEVFQELWPIAYEADLERFNKEFPLWIKSCINKARNNDNGNASI